MIGAALIAAGLWGGANVLDKMAVDAIGTDLAFVIMAGVYAVVCLGTAAFRWTDVRSGLAKLDAPTFALAAASGLAASFGTLAFFRAVQAGTEVHVVSAIAYTAPIFTLLFASLIARYRKRIVPRHIAGLLMVVAGVALVSF